MISPSLKSRCLQVSALILCLTGAARAAIVYSETTGPGTITFTAIDTYGTGTSGFELDTGTADVDQDWNFTAAALAGWSQVTAADISSVVFTEMVDVTTAATDEFSPVIRTPTNSGLLQPLVTGGFYSYGSTGSQTEAQTFDAPYPDPIVYDTNTYNFSPSTISDPATTSGTIGTFITQMNRNAGTFYLDSVEVQITILTPEPATYGLIGAGLLGLALASRRFRRGA